MPQDLNAWLVNIGSGKWLGAVGTKPLAEPMLIYVAMWCN